MTDPDRIVRRSAPELAAATGVRTAAILRGLAALIPLPTEGLARTRRTGPE
jgi:hypothetical protein